MDPGGFRSDNWIEDLESWVDLKKITTLDNFMQPQDTSAHHRAVTGIQNTEAHFKFRLQKSINNNQKLRRDFNRPLSKTYASLGFYAVAQQILTASGISMMKINAGCYFIRLKYLQIVLMTNHVFLTETRIHATLQISENGTSKNAKV